MRTTLAKVWAREPSLVPNDMYWLPLPTIARGVSVAIASSIGFGEPHQLVNAARVVSLLYLWGAWWLLARCIAMLGGGRVAQLLFAGAFILNFGTLRLAPSAFSEPDSLFFAALGLWCVLRAEKHSGPTTRIAALLGVALTLGCLTRYENWSVAALFAVGFVVRWRVPTQGRISNPQTAMVLLIPALPIAAWVIASAAIQENPAHFIGVAIGHQISHSLVYKARLLARTLLSPHPILFPLFTIAAIGELIRRRDRPEVRWAAALLALLMLWAIYRIAFHVSHVRFAHDASVIAAMLGAVGLESLLTDARATRRKLAFALLALAALIPLPLARNLGTNISPDQRRFIRAINEKHPEGNILIADSANTANGLDIAGFRALMDDRRLMLDEWIGGEGGSAKLKSIGVQFILVPEGSTAPANSELLLQSASGWEFWKLQ